MKSDGNGGYNIQKGTFALLMIIIALFSSVATVVAYGATIKADVDNLKIIVAKVSEDHPKYQKAIVINQEKIIAMKDDLSEIKFDIKELLSK